MNMSQPTEKNWGSQALICKAHVMPPVYKKVEDLTAGDVLYLEDYAKSLKHILKNGKSTKVCNARAEIRQELNRVIQFLFQFNINLTSLTYGND